MSAFCAASVEDIYAVYDQPILSTSSVAVSRPISTCAWPDAQFATFLSIRLVCQTALAERRLLGFVQFARGHPLHLTTESVGRRNRLHLSTIHPRSPRAWTALAMSSSTNAQQRPLDWTACYTHKTSLDSAGSQETAAVPSQGSVSWARACAICPPMACHRISGQMELTRCPTISSRRSTLATEASMQGQA